ncbi:MAG: tRNA (guanosine(37)-N1)-methyltransferase TrmD [Candidatus Marinimicrobia bacterium]|nr:tRNA (guanosine(37)-N1)-methyltransferase TrmD [Candidatus Neomarinimicrobiota bacterium]
MKHIALITPVPGTIETLIENSILRKARSEGIVQFHIIDLRDFGKGNYRQIDDKPFGGGEGMVLMAEPLQQALEVALVKVGGLDGTRIIYPSPSGNEWSQKLADECSQDNSFIFICGHYKGIDERIIDKYVTHEYSIGDFVLTSGEMPAMLMADSIVRLIPGVLNSIESALSDTFPSGLLDHPHYTQPRVVDGMEVPDVLLSGHHAKIQEWKKEKREERTKEFRPDLWKKYLNEKNENGD